MFMWWNIGQDIIDDTGQVRRIRPFKYLGLARYRDDITDYNTRRNINKARVVMNEVERICRERGVLAQGEEIMPQNLMQCYRTGFREVVETVYGKDAWVDLGTRKRFCSYSYILYYKNLGIIWRSNRSEGAAPTAEQIVADPSADDDDVTGGRGEETQADEPAVTDSTAGSYAAMLKRNLPGN
ncbi:hypothetical protein GUITHDRAFT_156499 [Guillardia theta CCMP2712]|uniref:Uncharacterized protein n=1 Tax=Guillardia theta (strain CCMP2712) TaxID=905079 RepID=L1I794_GUITC|nr:hypothetical protein GUITHDRAFT_156499 [Guillardia theta CCMP2712]EKX31739.1 hypothetical protein GUITHDRAFT_156499 [Guillardia theta CCMP2712]|eukprot:XP_005818719.1 hypothetical protein GUITHDRAFT_156499 [Guillardia theta CCMP2712]